MGISGGLEEISGASGYARGSSVLWNAFKRLMLEECGLHVVAALLAARADPEATRSSLGRVSRVGSRAPSSTRDAA